MRINDSQSNMMTRMYDDILFIY